MKTEKANKDNHESSISSFIEGYDRDDHYNILGDFEVGTIM
jgi:hypothetical protein